MMLPKVVEHFSDISQQYSSDCKDVRGDFNEQRHIDFSSLTSRFYL